MFGLTITMAMFLARQPPPEKLPSAKPDLNDKLIRKEPRNPAPIKWDGICQGNPLAKGCD